MKPSAQTIAVARVAIAKEIQHGNRDPRLRAAFNELRQCLLDEQERAIDADAMPERLSMFHIRQAG